MVVEKVTCPYIPCGREDGKYGMMEGHHSN